MNIYHLQSAVDEAIYERGLEYFLSGKIVQWSSINKHIYVFQVKGSRRYEVAVEINEQGDIKSSYCNCPYGPVCKHEVAVYMQLAEILQGKNVKPNTASVPAKLREVLQNLKKDKLIDIIIDIAEDDDTLAERLMITYAKGEGKRQLQQSKQLIDAIVDDYADPDGFVPYGATFPLSEELGKILDSAGDVDDILLATDIVLSVLHTAVDTFSNADDSAGVIGDVAKDAIEVLNNIALKSVQTGHEKKAIYEKVLAEADKQAYQDWTDFQLDLLSVGTIFAGTESLRKQLVEKIERFIEQPSDSMFWKEGLYELLLEMKEEHGTPEETEQFLYEHIHLKTFREHLLEKLLQEKDYDKVLSLAKEGEEQDEKHPGFVKIWENYRYQAVKGLSLKEEQEALAMELFLNGDFDYYDELKEIAENKQVMYKQLIEALKASTEWHTNRLLLQLIEEENDLEELLQFVKRNPFYIREYADQLIDRDREFVIDIYEASIKLEAEQTSNRKEYRRLCREIKKFANIAGAEHKERLVKKLTEEYQRRPAFVDELGKI